VPAVPEFVLQSQIIVYHSIARERVDAMPERRWATVGSLLSSVKEQHLGHPRTSPLAVCMAFSSSRGARLTVRRNRNWPLSMRPSGR
jgi:hypothetical protein